MIKVIVGDAKSHKTDLFPETTTIREVLEDFELDSSGGVMISKCGFLREEDLDKPLKNYARDSAVLMSVVPRVSDEAPIKDDTPFDDDPPWDEEPDADIAPADHAEAAVPAESSVDKAQEIREVITILAKEVGKKACRFAPLFFAALGIVELILFLSGSNMFIRMTYPLLILMLICSNMLWYCSNESKAKKEQATPDQQQTEAGSAVGCEKARMTVRQVVYRTENK